MIRNKILYVCLLLILAVFYILYIDNLSFFLLLFAFILPFVLFAIIVRVYSCIDAEIISSRMSENKNTDITIDVRIKNKSIFPIPNACLSLEIMNVLDSMPEKMTASIPIQSKNSQSMSFNISSKYCGKLIITFKQIKIYDYIKLFSLRKKFNQQKEIVIMPQTYPVQIFADHSFDENTDSELYSKFKAGDDCSEVFDIRNYNEGDKINKIHWKLSMKQDELMVKDYSLPINCSVLLLFEFYTDYSAGYMMKLDTLIETLSSISESIAESEAVHEIGWYDDSKSLYASKKIMTNEDVASFLGTLMHSKAYTDKNKVYFQHEKINAENKYSHVIYITSCITEEVFKNILSDENTNRKTIVYITDNTENLPQFFLKADERITVIPVQCGKISQCLYEMLV